MWFTSSPESRIRISGGAKASATAKSCRRWPSSLVFLLNLILNNRFVSAEELVEHVGAADIYITPYRQEAQVVSGTLAIALGAGKAIISTPYWHAKELLAEKRGVIVPFDSPGAIAEAVLALLENDAERHAMRKRAYLHSRGTTWPKTARAYMATFQRARFERTLRPRAAQPDDAADLIEAIDRLPVLNTRHLSTMTDDTGMLQHAIFSVPNTREGYTTDDNARALIVSTLLDERQGIEFHEEQPESSLAGISLFSGSPFIPILAGSGISSVTTANGWRTLARKTATAAPYGLWALCLAIRRMPDCAERQEGSLRQQCLQL